MKNCLKPTFKGRLQVIGMSRLLSGVCRIQIVLALLIFIPASVDAKSYLDLRQTGNKQQTNDSRESELIAEIDRLQKEGRYQEAIQPATELLRIIEAKNGPDHPDVA